MTFAGQRVLITGGAGLIGSAIAKRMVEAGARTTIIDALDPHSGANLHNLDGISDRARVEVADIRDSEAIGALAADADVVFNLAARSGHLESMQDPFPDIDVNARAQLSILEGVRRGNPQARIVFASTRQVYGRPQYLPVDEAHRTHPVDVNGINKLSGEWYHRLYAEVYGLRTCVLRLTNTYGPGMRIKDARQTFVGVWLRRLLERQPLEVWGGEQLRDFNYVDDVVDAFLLAATTEGIAGQVFNLGSPEVVSLKQLAMLLVDVNGGGSFEIKEFPAERKRIDIGDYYSDFAAIGRAVGWQPRVPLRDGLKRTLGFFRERLERYL
jgi:UDP-glucose 4-epimerase